VTFEDYLRIDAMNWSTLKHLATSARLLRWRVEHPREETDALERGRWIHCALLEPDRWAAEYIAAPDFGDCRFKAAKAERDAWRAANAGREIVDAESFELVTRCVLSIREHKPAARLLRAGRAEEVVRWTDEETGVAMKARLDFVSPTFVLDVKSTRQSSLWAFARDAASMLYHGQLALYHDAAVASRLVPRDSLEGPFVLAVQTVEPHDVIVARLSLGDVEKGRGLYRSLLRRYVECQAADLWPGIAPGVVNLSLPPWAAQGDDADTGEEW
jgi:hypothetical protein